MGEANEAGTIYASAEGRPFFLSTVWVSPYGLSRAWFAALVPHEIERLAQAYDARVAFLRLPPRSWRQWLVDEVPPEEWDELALAPGEGLEEYADGWLAIVIDAWQDQRWYGLLEDLEPMEDILIWQRRRE